MSHLLSKETKPKNCLTSTDIELGKVYLAQILSKKIKRWTPVIFKSTIPQKDFNNWMKTTAIIVKTSAPTKISTQIMSGENVYCDGSQRPVLKNITQEWIDGEKKKAHGAVRVANTNLQAILELEKTI